MGNDRIKTNSIIYSWDEGKTWQDQRFSDEDVFIKNIIIDPMGSSQHFLIYGLTESEKGVKKGFLANLDFNKLHEPKCRNPNEPNTPNSDYESWTPNDGRFSRECLMGKKVIYIRRKRDSECFNGLEFERKVVEEQCHCTDDDYECDFGFHRINVYDICTSIDDESEKQRGLPPKVCNGYYTISKGYRKVPGNSCVGGVKFDPIIIPCQNKGIFSTIGIGLFFIILIILILHILSLFNKNMFHQCYKYFTNSSNTDDINLHNYGHEIHIQNNKADQKQGYIDIDEHDNTLFPIEDDDSNSNLNSHSIINTTKKGLKHV